MVLNAPPLVAGPGKLQTSLNLVDRGPSEEGKLKAFLLYLWGEGKRHRTQDCVLLGSMTTSTEGTL